VLVGYRFVLINGTFNREMLQCEKSEKRRD